MMRNVLSLALLALSLPAIALPTGPTVGAGSATFTTSGGTLTIQNTDKTIINWQGFSIGAGETTRFNQPSASSSVLNRVVSANPSSILGSLTSNGNVFLVNPNGILIGAGSQVSVGGLTLSTSDISNANFLAGNNVFAGSGSGTITVDASLVTTPLTIVTNGIVTGGVVTTGQVTAGGGVVVSGCPTQNSPCGSITLNTGLTSSGSVTLTGAGGLTTANSGSISLAPVVTTASGGISLTAGGSLTVSGSGPAASAPGTSVQSGALAVVSKSPATTPVSPSIPASLSAFPAAGGVVVVTSVALNLEKREAGF